MSHRLVKNSAPTLNFATSTPSNSPGTSPTDSPRLLNLLATSPNTLVKRLAEENDNQTIIDSAVIQQAEHLIDDSIVVSEQDELLRIATFGHLDNIVSVAVTVGENLDQIFENSVEDSFHDTLDYKSDSDSDDYSEMAGIALMPGYFKGQQSEDAENWWQDVENWCAYKRLTDREKIGLIPLLLKDSAKQWFQSMDETDRDTFDKIKEAFNEQFKRDSIHKWKDSAAVWSTVQGEKQSVEDYFSEVLKKAQRADRKSVV